MDISIHPTQNIILRDLLFKPEAGYSELQKISGLESDHFKFHIGRLVELGYVEKMVVGKYKLSSKGKEYANKLDTDIGKIERQPKSAVIIVACNSDGTFLLQERLKHPYFGFWGYPGGKIRWGETILEAGARELLEETGLRGDIAYQGVYHEHVIQAETNKIIEDKIFHVVSATNLSGELQLVFDGGKNAWLTETELAQKEKKYASCDIETRVGMGKEQFIEAVQVYTKEEF
jgi:8-oxo-dGTP diphosphatase